MKFLFDLQVLQSTSRLRGIGRYSRGLAAALLHDFGGDASVLLNLSLGDGVIFDRIQQWVLERAPAGGIRAFRGLTRIEGRDPAHDEHRRACALCYDAYVATLGVDIVYIASPFEGFVDDTAAGWGDLAGPARAATLYDLIPFQQPDIHLDNPVRADWYNLRLRELARADVLLAPSEATRTVALDMLGISPDRVVNISADCDPDFKKIDLQPDLRNDLLLRYGISKPFIIHVGPAEPRKNVATLIRAFGELLPELRTGHQLLLAGEMTDAQRQEIAAAVRKARLDPVSVILPGFVPGEDLVALYGLTRVAVVPSQLEGFGLPLLEAMRCGAPVLGANCSSLPEVVGTEELLFDPRRANQLAAKLTLMLTGEGFRTHALAHCERQQKQFSWRQSAAIAHEAFSEAVARRSAEPHVPANGKRKYVLVPRRDIAVDQALSDTVAQLRRTEDVVIALPPDAQAVFPSIYDAPVVDSAAIEVSGDQRVVIVGSLEGLDDNQQTVLAITPAVLVKLRAEPPSSSAIDVIYRLGGYPALQAAGGPVAAGGQDFAGCSYPNVIATLGGEVGLAERIESACRSHPLGIVPSLLDRLRAIESIDISETALIIAENQSEPIAPRLLVDLSSLVRHDAGSGVQRVVKAILTHVFTEEHEWRVEPIYRDGDIYRYARKFCCRFLNVEAGDLTDAVVDFHPSDTFLGLDLDAELTEPAANILRHHRRRGMRIIFVVYDLLAILRGDWFGPYINELMIFWFHRVVSIADQLVAISRSVADDIDAFLDRLPKPPAQRPIISWWHLGSDFMVTAAAHQTPQTLDGNDFESLGRTVFLTVGTIEPRKGIGQLLDAADDLWRTHDVTFIIVGKQGWLVDDLVQRMKAHPEFGKRLLWFDRSSDLILDRLYGLATAALLPSEGEGFGLPLIEAARRRTPIIARDIAVFREIGGSGVFYFTAKSGAELATALRDWVALYQRGEAPKPELKVATWRESSEQLLGIIRSVARAHDMAGSRQVQ